MTNDKMLKDETHGLRVRHFWIRASFVIRHSGFLIPHHVFHL